MRGIVFGLGLVALALAAGCSSSSSTGSSSSSVFCSYNIAGQEECAGYTNLNSDQVKAATDGCNTQSGVMIVSSCPSSGLLGCCVTAVGGLNEEVCSYMSEAGATAMDFQMNCTQTNGKWQTTM